MKDALIDMAGFSGAGLIVAGVYLIHVPASIIIGGMMLLSLAILAGRRSNEES